MASTSLLDRVPPQSVEAEKGVLGSMLRDNEVIGEVIQVLRGPEHFYRDAHQKVFKAIVDCYDHSKAIDLIILHEELRRRGELEAVGGDAYLAELFEATPTAANAEYYARIVSDKSLVRSLIHSATEILRDAYEGGFEADDLLDYSQRRIFDVSQKRSTGQVFRLDEVLGKAFDAINDRADGGGHHLTGLSTGFHELDDITGGLQSGELIILAARPSMGKTALALNIAEHTGVEEGTGVAFFSLEQSKQELAQRLLCSRAKVDGHKLRRGFLQPKDTAALARAAGELSETAVFVDDSPGQTALEIRAKARRLKLQHKIGLVVVDYLQLMESRGPVESRQQQIAEISRGMKSLARELDVPVLALSQLNRAVEQREGHRPRMSDLRESGALEQDADVILLMHRDDVYDQSKEGAEASRDASPAEVIVAKQRNGPTGRVELTFLKKYMRFEARADRSEPF